MFLILPMITETQAQSSTPVKLTQEIKDENAPLMSESVNFVSSNSVNNPVVFNAKPTKPAPQPKSYALTIEIDYIEGHEPTQSVLDYMESYYQKEGITITYDIATMPILNSAVYSDGISDSEFWTIEQQYNQGADAATSSADGKYTLPEKWVLFGTTVQGSAKTVGYTYCIGTNRDLVAGNYIYIADKAADDWATIQGVTTVGAEAVVLMHEFGHSIGICVVRAGSEVYCSDYYCVMSYLRPQNAGYEGNWYYCSNHWKTKNLDYYVV